MSCLRDCAWALNTFLWPSNLFACACAVATICLQALRLIHIDPPLLAFATGHWHQYNTRAPYKEVWRVAKAASRSSDRDGGKDDSMGTNIAFKSKVPQRFYATTLDEQLEQLETDGLMLRSCTLSKRGR